jgi:hypothetical protein
LLAIDGQQALEMLRDNAELSRRFESSGISGFLQKPYRAAAILSKVRQHLELLTP